MKSNQNRFTKISEPVDENLCFVLMPFRPEIQLFDLNGNYLGTLQTIPEIMFFNTCKGLAVDSKGDIYVAKTDQIIKLTRI